MGSILDYIGDDFARCAYMYIDLKKYGLKNENIDMWKGDGFVALRYYTGMHIFSRGGMDGREAAELIASEQPAMVCGMSETIETAHACMGRVSAPAAGYELEEGLVAKLKGAPTLEKFEGKNPGEFTPHRASLEEMEEIAQLLYSDEALGGPYTFDLLYGQLRERFLEGFGRNYVIRHDGKIIAHAATYAEESSLAVISGVMVHPDYRGRGLSSQVLGALCRELMSEGFEVISYYYIESARRAHESVGFREIGSWAKLIQK